MRTKELKAECDRHDPWPVFEKIIGRPLKRGQMIISPFRKERTPSFGVYRGGDGKVRFKDFAGEYGDIYQLVQHVYKVDWPEAVRIVAEMLGVQASVTPRPPARYIIEPTKPIQTPTPAHCSFVRRDWNQQDEALWGRWNISTGLLNQYDVHPAGTFMMRTAEGKELTWYHRTEDPLYVYAIGLEHLKLYRPLAPDKKHRYIGNTGRDDIFGQYRIDRDMLTMICAGQKDALTMMANFCVRAIAFNAEGLIPDETTMLRINNASRAVAVLYDNDPTGIRYSHRLKERYPFLHRIPFEEFASHKDISDEIEAENFEVYAEIAQRVHDLLINNQPRPRSTAL